MHYPTPSRVHVYQKHFSPSILKVIERLALLSTESRSVFPKSFSLWKLKVDICVYVHIYIYMFRSYLRRLNGFSKEKKRQRNVFKNRFLRVLSSFVSPFLLIRRHLNDWKSLESFYPSLSEKAREKEKIYLRLTLNKRRKMNEKTRRRQKRTIINCYDSTNSNVPYTSHSFF